MINTVTIVGGGFAGWFTAVALQRNCPGIKINLIESPTIPRLGVGETLGFESAYVWRDLLGCETDHMIMRETGSIYKFGVRNFGFLNDGEDVGNGQLTNMKVSSLVNYFNAVDYTDVYEHWNKHDGDMGVANVWLYLNKDLLNKPGGKTMDDFLVELQDTQYFVQNPYVPYNKDGKKIVRHFSGTSFHMDAEQMVSVLKSLAYQRNTDGRLTHIIADVLDVTLDSTGAISGVVRGDNHEALTSDIYIDCTGFARVLTNKVGNDSWQDRTEWTNNSAWVCPSKYTDPHKEMICSTNIHGEDHGWRFQLNLYHRRGNGYVFNSNWVDPEVTLKRIKEVTEGTRLVEPRLIQWKPGFYTKTWNKNCIQLGVSSGLSDPWDAPTFSEHVKGVEDLIKVYKQLQDNATTVEAGRDLFNANRVRITSERDLRVRTHHGFSNRSGPYWDKRRQAAQEQNLLQDFEEILTERKTEITKRYLNYWEHIYAKMAIQTKTEIKNWPFAVPTKDDIEMAQAYFAFNRARNKYIRTQQWPNAYEWLRANRFDGLSSQEVFEEFKTRNKK